MEDLSDVVCSRIGGEGDGADHTTSTRQAIEETLRGLHDHERRQRAEEAQRREIQDDYTKSVVKVMHSDTKDCEEIRVHARTWVAGEQEMTGKNGNAD